MTMYISQVAWNLVGLIIPLMVAGISVPPLISRIGEERFGILALAWGLIGYAGMLDLGISRALTQMVARLRGKGKDSSISNVMVTAERITFITGSISGLLIVFVALIGGEGWIKTENIPKEELKYTMLLMAIALPAHAMSATYRGMNEAYLKFRGISILRMLLGAINFGGPYFISLFTNVLSWLVLPLVVSRIVLLLIFRRLANLCLRDSNVINVGARYSSDIARALFRFGGWVTVSNIISPIMLHADRFLIAAVISTTAVTIYVVPYEVVVQSLVLVSSISSVVFSNMSNLIYEDNMHLQSYFRRWLAIVIGLMFIACLLMVFLLPMALRWWLKENFNEQSALIGQVLCLGAFANGIGSMYYVFLHAKGRTDLTAKLHLVELPMFVFFLILLLDSFGIVGAAWAWVGRMVFDAIALCLCSRFHRD